MTVPRSWLLTLAVLWLLCAALTGLDLIRHPDHLQLALVTWSGGVLSAVLLLAIDARRRP